LPGGGAAPGARGRKMEATCRAAGVGRTLGPGRAHSSTIAAGAPAASSSASPGAVRAASSAATSAAGRAGAGGGLGGAGAGAGALTGGGPETAKKENEKRSHGKDTAGV